MPELKTKDRPEPKANVGGRFRLKLTKWAELDVSRPTESTPGDGKFFWILLFGTGGLIGLAFAKAPWYGFASLAGIAVTIGAMVFGQRNHGTSRQIDRRQGAAQSGPEPESEEPTG